MVNKIPTVDSTTNLFPTAVMGALDGRYAPLPATGLSISSLRKTRSAIGTASTGQGFLKILCIGDSITGGTGSFNSPSTGSFPARLHAAIRNAGVPSGGTGRSWPAHNTTPSDTRWSFTGGFAPYQSGSSFLVSASVTNATATFVSDMPGENLDIYYTANSGAFTYSVDGGAPVTVTGAGGNTWAGLTVNGLPNTVHTVVITTQTNTFTGIGAVNVYRFVGVSVENAGDGGALSSSWLPTADWFANGPTIKACSSDAQLTIIESMMVNDAQNGVTPGTHQANLTAIISAWQTVGEVILWVPPTSSSALVPTATFASLRQAVYAAAAATGVPLIDISARWGDYPTANSLGYMSDGAHPTSSGYDDIARAFAKIIFV